MVGGEYDSTIRLVFLIAGGGAKLELDAIFLPVSAVRVLC